MLNPFEGTKGVKIVSEESAVHYISEPANSAQYLVCFRDPVCHPCLHVGAC